MQRKKYILKGIASLLLYFGISRVIASLIIILLYKTKNSTLPIDLNSINIDYIVISTFVALLTTLVVLFIVNFKELYANFKTNISNLHTYKSTVEMLGLYFITLMIVRLLIRLLNIDIVESNNQLAVVSMFDSNYIILVVITIVVLAPIVEEIVFRYSLLNTLDVFSLHKVFKALPYIVSALIFSLIHDTTIITDFSLVSFGVFIRYFAPSLVLAIAYMYTNRNIVTVILIHVVINFISVIAQFNLN